MSVSADGWIGWFKRGQRVYVCMPIVGFAGAGEGERESKTMLDK